MDRYIILFGFSSQLEILASEFLKSCGRRRTTCAIILEQKKEEKKDLNKKVLLQGCSCYTNPTVELAILQVTTCQKEGVFCCKCLMHAHRLLEGAFQDAQKSATSLPDGEITQQPATKK